MILRARYVVPVDAPVIENGAVAIEGARIVAVGHSGHVKSAGPVIDYGDAVICPGFINAHTHLELSLLRDRVPPSTDFIDWLKRLMAEVSRLETSSKSFVERAVRAGIAESLQAGVTTVGDISRNPAWTRPLLAESTLRAVSFGEVIAIGTRRNLLTERLAAAMSSDAATEGLRIGISPHAPYTVEPAALRVCAQRAACAKLPIGIHLAETPYEDEFTRNATGPLADYLHALNVWDDQIPASGCGPVELAAQAGLLTPRTLVAHANYVSDRDIELLAETGAHVAYCPRTHYAFGHRPHRFREMLAAGINVCIGTDSLASNPSLSILEELRFLRRACPGAPPTTLLAMGSINGAKALGWSDEIGSLRTGKPADLVVIPLDGGGTRCDWAEVFHSDVPPSAVYLGGVNHRLSPRQM